ncbi:Ig-like domain-containing protein [Nocardia rhizosphaerae]|uniref:Ig-like domain-containing protein n=1 Tax=Nocardia rhizosphaerae TaxID=1691571 RepID=A0ABV8L6B3_9NOCA
MLVLAVLVVLTGCGTARPGGAAGPVARVAVTPAAGASGVDPVAPIGVEVSDGHLDQIALTNANGKQVEGRLTPDRTTYEIIEPLGYDATYTWTGTAIGTDGIPVPIDRTFTTLSPESTIPATVNIGDGQEVGIAAPIILKFTGPVPDKAAVERALTVTTEPATEGAWAWLPDDGGSRVHWRPRNYWIPGTKVHMSARLYGLDFGGGAYGHADLTTDFTIGRSQIVLADAPSHRMRVVRDGTTVFDFAVFCGECDEPRDVTRSGIHVVTEKYVTNGCIDLSPADAAAYFPTAMYGDPVEVTGTAIPLSRADGDIYDWAVDWSAWRSMSALAGASSSGPR